MAHQKYRRVLIFIFRIHKGLQEACYIIENSLCRPREALFRGLVDGTAPAPLVEGVCCDAAGCEGGEEDAVGVAMVAEAVDEDEAGFCGANGLWKLVGRGIKVSLNLFEIPSRSWCRALFHLRRCARLRRFVRRRGRTLCMGVQFYSG